MSENCVKHAYDPQKDDWSPEHFKYCEADLITTKLDYAKEIWKMIEKKFKELGKNKKTWESHRKTFAEEILLKIRGGKNDKV